MHTLVCDDINGLLESIFTDDDIRRGGSIIDSYYEILALDGFRLPPTPGSAQRVIDMSMDLLNQVFLA